MYAIINIIDNYNYIFKIKQKEKERVNKKIIKKMEQYFIFQFYETFYLKATRYKIPFISFIYK